MLNHTFRMNAMTPLAESAGGRIRVADSNNFPASKTIAAGLFSVKPGALRELPWHPDSEWQYFIAGSGRMTLFASAGQAHTMDYNANHVGFVPAIAGHDIQNTGNDDLVFLALFKRSDFVKFFGSVATATPRTDDAAAPPPEFRRDRQDSGYEEQYLPQVDLRMGCNRRVRTGCGGAHASGREDEELGRRHSGKGAQLCCAVFGLAMSLPPALGRRVGVQVTPRRSSQRFSQTASTPTLTLLDPLERHRKLAHGFNRQ
jgi:hypothetical protein